MNKKQIKEVFKNHKVQLGTGALAVVENEINRYVTMMAVNCNNGNLKRLTPDTLWVALNKHEL
tara:strand:+ start:7507 stop:7695 length:189 start_codon:yes stop_codon:yes gene_type:complete